MKQPFIVTIKNNKKIWKSFDPFYDVSNYLIDDQIMLDIYYNYYDVMKYQ